MRSLVFLAILATATHSTVSGSSVLDPGDNVDLRVINALAPYKTQLRKWFTRINSPEPLFGKGSTIQEDYFGCDLCLTIVPLARALAGFYPDRSKLIDVVVTGCKILDLAPKPEICPDIINSYADQFLYLFLGSSTPVADMCGVLNEGCGDVNPVLTDWEVYIDPDKPKLENREPIPATVTDFVKIVQFTDIHLDLNYVEGMGTNCGPGMPVCCREGPNYGPPADGEAGAGKYGDWMCALPIDAFEAMLIHAREQNPKYFFLTGDFIHSAVWEYSEEENSKHILGLTQKVAEVFKDTDVKIYPLTGNHEAHVVNMYTPIELWDSEPGFSIEWMYANTTKAFTDRDPNLMPIDQLENFHKYGYYSVQPEPGVRILAINSNLCYTENFWLAAYPQDPNKQLEWLSIQLHKAELEKEAVFIIGHIEAGSCWHIWSDKYNDVVNRFENVIRGQFFGHSHRSQFRLNFDKKGPNPLRPTTTSIIAGSALTDSMNPAYAMYHVDGARPEGRTWDLFKMELTILDLLDSNANNAPVLRKLADSNTDFGLPDLRPATLFDFGEKLACNQELLDKYLEFHTKGSSSPAHYKCSISDKACVGDVLCTLYGSNANNPHPCTTIRKWIAEPNFCDPNKVSTTTESSSARTYPGALLVLGLTTLYFHTTKLLHTW